MTNALKIKVGGIGGQGVQFFSKLLAQAAFRQGLNVSTASLYEPASTGGLTLGDVVIAHHNEEIVFPFVEIPSILICFAQRAWDELKNTVTKHTIILADEDNVQYFSGKERELGLLSFHLPFFREAKTIGTESVGNIVALGFVSEMLDIADHYIPALLLEKKPEDAENHELLEVDPKYFEESLINSSPDKFREMNLKAFQIGYAMSKAIDYSKETIIQQLKQSKKQ